MSLPLVSVQQQAVGIHAEYQQHLPYPPLMRMHFPLTNGPTMTTKRRIAGNPLIYVNDGATCS